MEEKKTITLEMTGLHVEGTARLLLWGGGEGDIRMDPFDVEDESEIPSMVNDGRFGCEAILGAECDIYENYEGHHVYRETRHYTREQLTNAKTGV